MSGPSNPDAYLMGRVLSSTPLVTISSMTDAAPLGLFSIAPDLLGDVPALHLLHPTWTMEMGVARWAGINIAAAASQSPNSQFLVLASNELESLACAESGAPSIVASSLMMLDERVWRPVPASAQARHFDAVYCARLDRFKRHELAANLRSLLLIYGGSLDEDGGTFDRLNTVLPFACFANHEANNGKYGYIDHSTIAALYGRSDVGLCLSAVEGCMRASMEYLLCGLPIVSTKSVGGRDRYFVGSYCRVVDDDADAVAFAVQQLKDLNLDRQRIRSHVAQIVAFDRHNFLLTINRLIETRFGASNVFRTIDPFIGSLAVFQSAADVYRQAKSALAGGQQGKS